MTQYEIDKLLNHRNTLIVYGTHEKNLSTNESVISLGYSTNELNIESVLTHEYIHMALTELFNEHVSFLFDRGLYYNFNNLTKGEFKGLRIRDSLIGFFEDICFI
jgi:hypothetical protein